MLKNINKLFDAAVTEDLLNFKEAFKSVFVEEFNNACNRLEKDVTKELARFETVVEGISIPLNNPKIRDAHLFGIEIGDDDSLVLKFDIDGEELSYNVPESKQDFYKALEGKEDLSDDDKERIATDLNEFMNDVEKDKKDESIERGDELKKIEVKMEADKMASVDKETRLKLLKKLGEKMKNEKSKSMQEEDESEDEKEDMKQVEEKKKNKRK